MNRRWSRSTVNGESQSVQVGPEELYEYYEALTEIEIDLEESEDLNVFLAPSDPPGQPSENGAGLPAEMVVVSVPSPRSTQETS